jgi:hypothetical protein
MNTIRVSIYLVDGGLQEFDESPAFLQKLCSIQSQGFTGKQLVHHLITDDWSVPPTVVEISGKDSDGKNFEIRIPYT